MQFIKNMTNNYELQIVSLELFFNLLSILSCSCLLCPLKSQLRQQLPLLQLSIHGALSQITQGKLFFQKPCTYTFYNIFTRSILYFNTLQYILTCLPNAFLQFKSRGGKFKSESNFMSMRFLNIYQLAPLRYE